MRIYFDERALDDHDLVCVLKAWAQAVERVRAIAPGVHVVIDHNATKSHIFLARLGGITSDLRRLFNPLLFQNNFVANWREVCLCAGHSCRLVTEACVLVDAGVCEAYEHLRSGASVALFGSSMSSYSELSEVSVDRLEPVGGRLVLDCGSVVSQLGPILDRWGVVAPRYDVLCGRPPTDAETVLVRDPLRFQRVGRFERNGRRSVYRELASGRLFYVDNLHVNQAAHLEVFSSDEDHIGTADLDGNVDANARVLDRKIRW